ncbi:MAG: TctA family transporter [Candidatus Nanohaloarchaea archaeon]|jgi:TctA family transporter
MDLDRQTGKLLAFFLLVNLLSAVLGLAAVYFLGVLPGLAIFSVLIIVLPLALQYIYLSREKEINRKETAANERF